MKLRDSLAGVLAGAILLASGGAFAATAPKTTVSVTLGNKSPMPAIPTNLAYGAPGVAKAKAKSPMSIKLSKASAKAGEVTFSVKNGSKETVHEMVVVAVDKAGKALPYDASASALDESKVKKIGEVSELDPGKTGTFTAMLQPGKYLLVCNVAGHFAGGMWAEFTVTK